MVKKTTISSRETRFELHGHMMRNGWVKHEASFRADPNVGKAWLKQAWKCQNLEKVSLNMLGGPKGGLKRPRQSMFKLTFNVT